MKRIICLYITLVSLSISNNAQPTLLVEHITAERYLFPMESDMHYVFADEVLLRNDSSQTSTASDVLSIGVGFKILSKSKRTLTIDGIESAWYQIQTELYQGWIWGGYIAEFAAGSNENPDCKFLGGHIKLEGRKHSYCLKAVFQNEERHRIVLETSVSRFYSPQVFGKRGLKNVDDIIVLESSGASCGTSSLDYYVFWSRNNFFHAFTTNGIPDGEYSQGDQLIFPSDMEGIPGKVIQEKRFVSNDDRENEILERSITRQLLHWNGKSLEKVGPEGLHLKYNLSN
ncbi:MAG: hypothetical protein MRY83_09455 [Flavobacteriales bacterium]|nr:hypothetical protein [Flavobacteriales bacterium]